MIGTLSRVLALAGSHEGARRRFIHGSAASPLACLPATNVAARDMCGGPSSRDWISHDAITRMAICDMAT